MPHDFKFISTSLLKGLLFGIGFMAVAVAGSHYIAAVFGQTDHGKDCRSNDGHRQRDQSRF